MKYKYSVNNNNQLLIKPTKAKTSLPANGYFSTDTHNRLIYWLNMPAAWLRRYALPHKITFEGSWRLNENYDLELVLDKTRDQLQGNILAIRGKIISVDNDILAFEVKTYEARGLLQVKILKLYIIWLADRNNRLTFIVKKYSPDIIVLEGGWEINKNQQISYTYEKTELKTKTKTSHTFTFTGFWKINEKNRLTYILSQSRESRFDFRAQIESLNLYPKEGVIKYRMGIGLKEPRLFKEKIICLYGVWKFSRQFGLIFQMDYGQGRMRSIEFGSDISITQRDKITFILKNKKGEALGLSFTFTHEFLKRANEKAFLRLKKLLHGESAIEGGISIPF